MNKLTITNAFSFDIKERHSGLKDIFIKGMDEKEDKFNKMECSDGYHTFDELYEHRITLFIALGRQLMMDTCRPVQVWRSKFHSDGTFLEGWFIMGIGSVKGKQITYHLPLSKWEETNFCFDMEKAPEFDGHTSNDVLNRLKTL